MPSTTNDVVLYTGEASPNDVRLRHSTFLYAACVGACSTVAYLKTGDIEVFQVALNTVTGTQDITYKGFGTPVGALVILTNAVANGAKADHAIIGFGATDGTRFFSCTSHIKHNVTTTLAGRRGGPDRFITLVGPDNADLVLADFTSWITDGLRITLNTAPGQAYLMTVVLFGGTGVANFHTDVVVTPATIDTATTVNVGFQPDGLIVVNTGIAWSDGNSTNAGFGLGFAQNTGTEPPTQFSHNQWDQTGAAAAAVRDMHSSAYAARDANTNWACEIKNFTATGYDAYTRLLGSAFTVGVIAFKLSGLRAKVLNLATPTANGSHDDVGIGFLSQFAMLSMGASDVNDTIQIDQEAEVLGVSALTTNVQSCHAITDQDNVSPTVAQSYVSLKPIATRRQGAMFEEASLTSFASDKMTLNYTTTNSLGRKVAALFIEQQPTSGASFAAAAFCVCSTSAGLTTQITMAAAASCLCSTGVALTTAITMAATCSGTCSTNLPVLNTAITMLASATCLCSTSAALTTAITMAASAKGVCATNLPALTTAITMAAAASCVCSTSAALATAITMASSCSCVCSTSAALTTQITMASSATGVCSTNLPALTTAITMAASATCLCSTAASLTTAITMAASCAGGCSTVRACLTATFDDQATSGHCSTSASLTTAITMAAATSCTCSTSASLSTLITMAASATCLCSTSAALTTAITMAASAKGVCATSAAITTAITCASSASGICNAGQFALASDTFSGAGSADLGANWDPTLRTFKITAGGVGLAQAVSNAGNDSAERNNTAVFPKNQYGKVKFGDIGTTSIGQGYGLGLRMNVTGVDTLYRAVAASTGWEVAAEVATAFTSFALNASPAFANGDTFEVAVVDDGPYVRFFMKRNDVPFGSGTVDKTASVSSGAVGVYHSTTTQAGATVGIDTWEGGFYGAYLTSAITLAAAASGICATSASLTTAIRCLASATGVCSTSAFLSSGMASQASCVCSTSAALSTQITMAAAATGVCSTSAACSTAIQCRSAASGACAASAALTTAIRCAASCAGICATQAVLATAILCLAAPSGHASCTASLTTAIGLACAATGQCGTAGKLAEPFQTKAHGACATSATLRVPFLPEVIVISDARAYAVQAHDRPTTCAADDRTYIATADDRPYTVEATERFYLVTAGGPDG